MAGDQFSRTTFAQLISDGALEIGDGYRAKNEELGGDGLIFLRAGHVTDTHIDFGGVERFHRELESRVRSKLAKPGDAIITTKGNSTGRTAFVSPSMPPFVYSPHLSYWRSLDPSRIAGGFLRYWSRGSEFAAQLAGMKASTDMAPYLSLVDQKRLEITLPPPDEQHAIAGILGTLDDEIELNRRMNETLESIARALFKSWFVDFDPVRAKAEGHDPGLPKALADLFPDSFAESGLGDIPEGWRLSVLGDVAEINARTLSRADTLEAIDYIEISEVMRGEIGTIVRYDRGAEPSRARRQLRHGDSVLSTVRPDRGAHFLCLHPPTTLIASTGFAVLSARDGNWAFLYSAVSRRELGEELGRLADGGAYPAVRPEAISAVPVVIPKNSQVVTAFERLTAPLFERADRNRAKSRTLASLRDALLPKLISGELRATEVDRVVPRTTA